jgi:hypothetical protein
LDIWHIALASLSAIIICLVAWFWATAEKLTSQLRDANVARIAADARAAKAEKEPTYEAKDLLHDLTEGAALVKITRISPLDVWQRRS